MASQPAWAGSLTTLYTFTGGADGGVPFAGLLPGPNGSFYGTTTENAGSVFQLLPPAQGQTAWTLKTLYTFTGGADGAFPQTLVMDSQGALYGMTDEGGLRNGVCAQNGNDIGCGTVFKLSPPVQGQSTWTLNTLWTFTGGADGSSPTGGVVFGPSGELYGFTYGGFTCPHGICGGVYKLTPPSSGQTGWTETTLYSFRGRADGAQAGSYGPPVLDADGRIFGVTGSGGDTAGSNCAPGGCGTVFSLSPPHGANGGWTKQTLMVFRGRNGIGPVGGLTQDADGNLYGATNEGGRLANCVPGAGYPNGCGVAFEVSPAAWRAGGWTSTVLHRFTDGADGGYPFAAPVSAGGKVYATTSGDEVKSFGSLVELAPGGQGGWRERTRFVFTNDANSSSPAGALLAQGGVLYGTTAGAGSGPAPFGTVFQYRP
jgi:hypothetical protein